MNIFSFHTILVDVYRICLLLRLIIMACFRTIFVGVYPVKGIDEKKDAIMFPYNTC